jgi:acetyl-CoA C-acetyltransferase
MASGIRDKVAILGMGCSKFGERWDADAEDLMVEAFLEARDDAGIDIEDIGAAWFASGYEEANVGKSAVPAATALRLPEIPVTRVENFCASGTEALRGAVYAVAAGACDIALALGAEKLKDAGYGGLPQRTRGRVNDMYFANFSGPGAFAQLAAAYRTKHGIDAKELKRAMAHISVKSHDNGVLNPRAHLRRKIDEDTVIGAPMIAEPLGLYDCCGVSDGAAAAIVTTPEIARALGKTDIVTIKAIQLAASNGRESQHQSWDGTHFATARVAAKRAYEEAGITNPRTQLDLIEVHDCFSITELVTMEDLFISPTGGAVKDVLEGFYDAGGELPCQIDGGLKCFGHPIGASGLRMAYELYLQMTGRAGDRQLATEPTLGLTHNLGGQPQWNVCSVAVLGRSDH